MTALRALDEWRDRKDDKRTEAEDHRMDDRVARLEAVTFANEVRRFGRMLQSIGVRDDSLEAHQIGLDLEARAARRLRQIGALR